MFLDNKYTRWYFNIINKANTRITNNSIYVERHHIIPKSMGGTDEKSNIIILTPKEHFICHLLLTKMVIGEYRRKMWYASYMMCRGQKRYKPCSRMYKQLKDNMRLANKERPGPNNGIKLSDETKKKISLAQKGIPKGPMSEEHKQKLSQPRSNETKQKISISRRARKSGYTHSEETKQKMSASHKDRIFDMITCEFCNKEMTIMSYGHWHGEKCKSNPSYQKHDTPKMNTIMKTCEYCNKEFNTGNYSTWHGEKCKYRK